MAEFVNALPYDITKRIRHSFETSIDTNDGKDSFYIKNSGKKLEIRVSNHCTHLWTWHEHKNGKFDDITRVSIVFEEKDTYDDKNLVLKKTRRTPLRVMEFVYRITDPNVFTPTDVTKVITAISKCLKKGCMFVDPTNKITYCKERVSVNPPKPDNASKKRKPKAETTGSDVNPVIESKRLEQIINEEIRKVVAECKRVKVEKKLHYNIF